MISILFFLILSVVTPASAIFEHDHAVLKGQQNAWEKSQEYMQKALIHNPTDPVVLYDAGVSAYKAGDYQAAQTYFSKTVDTTTDPQLKEQALFNTANAQVHLKKLPEALASLQEILAKNPTHKNAAHNKKIIEKMIEEEQKQKQQSPQNNKDKNSSPDNQPHNDQQEEQEKEKENSSDNQESEKNQQNDPKPNESEQQQQKNQQSSEQSDNRDSTTQQPESGSQSSPQQNTPQQQDREQQPHKKENRQQQAHKKNTGQPEPKKESPEARDKKESAMQKAESSLPEQKLSPALARILEAHEKKDAALNKKVIQAKVEQEGGSNNDQWNY